MPYFLLLLPLRLEFGRRGGPAAWTGPEEAKACCRCWKDIGTILEFTRWSRRGEGARGGRASQEEEQEEEEVVVGNTGQKAGMA